ncbi:(p)ppGpp synthase/HD superfamily hydrolase [Azospirillum fermentarium]|uniref:HD domain-containing protein n=1 Tax=Azospirillum fermentarium TaxID=1233114 RepID=UPI0022263ED4|nr:HD domain-containing protein [Azospirillum fermentarium]MCW2247692.1 (p)ppGpp synthase/HD superfamily hydrolase [Azospirillum fermentarium]
MISPSQPPLLAFTRALEFAAHKHTDQRRKGLRAEPYINHLAEVAHLVAEATGGEDVEAVIAGLLHDTMEDTDTSREELEKMFGPTIAAIVSEVTDDKRLTRAERKQRQIDTAPAASPKAKLVKIADKISNLRSMKVSPPANWSLSRRREYFTWAAAVVEGLRGTNATLERLFDEAYHTGLASLEEE